MRTGIVIVSHGDSALFMLEAAEKIVGELDARIVTVPFGEAREITAKRMEAVCAGLGDCEELLYLVDLEGSTPFNVCSKRLGKSVVLSGVNMPMLFKLATADRNRSAIELAEELKVTGQKSIHIRPGGSTGGRES